MSNSILVETQREDTKLRKKQFVLKEKESAHKRELAEQNSKDKKQFYGDFLKGENRKLKFKAAIW